MDQEQRWTPGPVSSPAGLADAAPDWNVVRQTPTGYVADPRWGLRPDPAVTTLAPPGAAPVGLSSFDALAIGDPRLGSRGPADPAGTGAFPTPPVFAPARTRTPGWVIGIVVAVVATLGISVLAAVAIPVFLNQRAKLATAALRTDLTTVAAAEESVRAQTGSYSADPAAVSAHLRDDLTSQVAILWADGTGWCAQAVPVGTTEPVLYASSASGVSTQSCG